MSEASKERSRHKLLQARALLARQVAPPAPFDVPPPQPGPTPAAREPWPAADSDPATASGSGSVEAIAPDARSAYARKAARALGFARAQIGRPCLRGAGGPDSYDCSGLTRAAWRTAGVTLPRTAHEQAGCGTAVPLAELRPGDLVFFHADAGHVGLYAGDGTVVHAPGPGAAVREESVFFAGARAVHSARRPA
ncbi:C40 family peptidase [Streptomyces seoulensis]